MKTIENLFIVNLPKDLYDMVKILGNSFQKGKILFSFCLMEAIHTYFGLFKYCFCIVAYIYSSIEVVR